MLFLSKQTFQKLSILSFFGAALTQAASFNLSGNYRFGSTMILNPDLQKGKAPGQGSTLSFLEHRAILRPDVVVDDRFTVKSELSLLQNTLNNPNHTGDGFGTALDRSATQYNDQNMLYVRRVYLEWTSDWGIFRMGRQPKAWGLGALYDPGNNINDDFGTTVDRAGFQAMLGNLTLNTGFEKGQEEKLKNDSDDNETYEMSVEYNNPESLFDVGLLYARNVRSGGGSLQSSHDVSIFLQKKWSKIQWGGELVTIKQQDRASAMAFLTQFDYTPSNWNWGLDLAYVTGKRDAPFAIHPNYQPFLLLYRHSLGVTKGNDIRGGNAGQGVGSSAGQGDGNGALLVKAGIAYNFDNKLYTLGTNFGYARLMYQGSNTKSTLGYETDIYFNHKWYDNFSTSYAAGVLVPQKGLSGSPRMAIGVQLRGALSF